MAHNKSPEAGSQVLTRGLRVLTQIARMGEVGVRELARELELPVTVVHRLVTSLAHQKYIEKSPESGKYKIGLQAFEVGRTYLRSARIEICAPPVLRKLVDSEKINAFLTVMRNLSAVYLIAIQDFGHYDIRIAPGSEVPLATTAMGKVLLADLTDSEILQKLTEYSEQRFSSFDIGHVDKIMQEINEIRQNGFCISEGGSFRGTVSIAAPVYNFTGRAIAAISLGRPTQLENTISIEDMVAYAIEAAKDISTCLGYRLGGL